MARYSDSKISLTLLEFGEFFLDGRDELHQRDEIEACMKIIVLVWNAVTLDTVSNTKENVTALLTLLADEPPEYVLLIKRLIMRKKRKYGSDLRGVGNTWFIEKDGELIFGCDARASAG